MGMCGLPWIQLMFGFYLFINIFFPHLDLHIGPSENGHELVSKRLYQDGGHLDWPREEPLTGSWAPRPSACET